jgi:Zn-dependent protease
VLAFADPGIASGLLFLYLPFLISTTFHEAAHALVAKLLGDQTAYLGGQVSLNPWPHIQREPFGMVVLPLVVLFSTGFSAIMGFAHIPVDAYWAERHPRRSALVSLAGPAMNFLLAAVAILVWNLMLWWSIEHSVDTSEGTNANIAFNLVRMFARVNVLLGVLNLVPLPPFDGAGVLGGFFPRTVGNLYAMLRSQPFIMLALVFALMTFGQKLYAPLDHQVDRWLGLR